MQLTETMAATSVGTKGVRGGLDAGGLHRELRRLLMPLRLYTNEMQTAIMEQEGAEVVAADVELEDVRTYVLEASARLTEIGRVIGADDGEELLYFAQRIFAAVLALAECAAERPEAWGDQGADGHDVYDGLSARSLMQTAHWLAELGVGVMAPRELAKAQECERGLSTLAAAGSL